jgi:hypothetical protein
MSAPTVTALVHPDWCDHAACSQMDWDHDGTVLVVHRAVLLEEGDLLVEVVQSDEICVHGDVVDSEPAFVRLGGLGGPELTAKVAAQLAEAITRAAITAGGAR